MSTVSLSCKANSYYQLQEETVAASVESFADQLIVKHSLSDDCIDLLKLMGCYETDLAKVVDYTQKHWLRKMGSERYQMSEIQDLSEECKQAIFDKLNKLGLIEAKLPKKTTYDYLLVLGAYSERMQSRLQFLFELTQNQLVKAKEWVFLSGQRPLEEKEITFLSQMGIEEGSLEQKTEAAALKALFYTQLPELTQETKLTFVNAPMKKGTDGKLFRPNTEDTFKKWKEDERPPVGSCLLIGEQPYSLYFQATAVKNLPGWKEIESCSKATRDTLLSIHLDNLARIFYTVYQTP